MKNVRQTEEDADNGEDDISYITVDEFFAVSASRPAAVANDDLPRAGEE